MEKIGDEKGRDGQQTVKNEEKQKDLKRIQFIVNNKEC